MVFVSKKALTSSPDGTKFYASIAGLKEYDLTTAWDISTIQPNKKRATLGTTSTGVVFGNDGLNIYSVGSLSSNKNIADLRFI